MSKLLVPSQYATIQSAITAAVSGDVVVVSAGTYAENLDLTSKTKLVVRAAFGESVVVAPPSHVSGTVKCAVKLDGASKVVFRDITFNISLTCDVGMGFDATACTGVSVLDCVFNAGSPGSSHPFGAFLRLGPGTGDRTTIVRRCIFNGVASGTASDRAVDFCIRIEGTAGDVLVELCSFTGVYYRYPLSGMFSGGSSEPAINYVRLTSPGSSRVMIRNCSGAANVYRHWINVEASGATIDIYNNLMYGDPYWHVYNIQASTGAYVGYNTLYDISGSPHSSSSFLPDTEQNTVTSPSASAPGGSSPIVLTATSGSAYRTGTTRTFCPLAADYNRYMFAEQPSRGCAELHTFDAVQHALHLKYVNVNVVDGLVVAVQDSGTPAGERRSYSSPFEVAKHTEILIGDLNLSSDISVWYDHTTNNYMAQSYPEVYFGLETAGMSRYLFGTPGA